MDETPLGGKGAFSSHTPDTVIGIISDTHGTLSSRAYRALKGSTVIIHAGDIGASSVLWELESIAPVTAVLGNCDLNDYGPLVGAVATPCIGGLSFKIVHKPSDLGYSRGIIDVCVCGHTHIPKIELVGGTLYVNPGSPTRPRGGFPPSIARIEAAQGHVLRATIVELDGDLGD